MCNVELRRSDVEKMMEGKAVRIRHEGEVIELTLSEEGKIRVVDYADIP